ncbi:hypothetical protein [Litorihabitans aurantiacus]|uniref:Uncharacterized protein n=1 Tax=Litorihabitans aurantiacus TaxID=1930061 RepID=A0AA37XGA8_9MICO|nr:hypothetical protein [Litorihabitans aurantiacus]GMA32744.1 hypothetical protein GCM10025875_27360 [Litorihabitans aurantiacus]
MPSAPVSPSPSRGSGGRGGSAGSGGSGGSGSSRTGYPVRGGGRGGGTGRTTSRVPWVVFGVAGVVLVGAVVGGIQSGGSSGGSSYPRDPVVDGEPDTSQEIWSTRLSDGRLVGDPIGGARSYTTPVGGMAVVGEHAVGRFSDAPYDDTITATVRSVSLADGSSTDLVTMQDPRCAAVPYGTPELASRVACAGEEDGATVAVVHDVTSGEETERWRTPSRSR